MAYETKVILMSLANQVALVKTAKQAFELIRAAAQVEGLSIREFEDIRSSILGGEEAEE